MPEDNSKAALDNLFAAFDEAATADVDVRREELIASGIDPDALVEEGRSAIRRALERKPAAGETSAGGRLRAVPVGSRRLSAAAATRVRAPSPQRLKLVDRKQTSDDDDPDDDGPADLFQIVFSCGHGFRAERTMLRSFVETYNPVSGPLWLRMIDIDRHPLAGAAWSRGAPELFVGIVDWRQEWESPDGCPALRNWRAARRPRALFFHYLRPTFGVLADSENALWQIQAFDAWATLLAAAPFISQPFYDLHEFEEILFRNLEEVLPMRPKGARETLESPADAVFSRALPGSSPARSPFRCELDLAMATVETRVRYLLRMLSQLTDLAAADQETLGISIDALYSRLESVCRAFEPEGLAGPRERYGEYFDYIQRLLSAEGDLWRRLRSRFWARDPREPEKLAVLARNCAGRRATTIAELERIGRYFSDPAAAPGAHCRAGTSARKANPLSCLKKQLLRLRAADELDEEDLMAEILELDGGDLARQVAAWPAAEREPLVESLWRRGHWLVAQTVGRGDSSGSGLLTALAARDGRFAGLERLLQAPSVKRSELVERPSDQPGDWEFAVHDREVVWRCLVVGHGDPATRTFAADRLTMDSLWKITTCPYTPMAALSAIAQRIKLGESENLGKVFFDCIRSRLAAAFRSAEPKDDLEDVQRLVLTLVRFDFFIQTSYFRRLEALLRQLFARTASRDLARRIEDKLERLRFRRERAGRPGDHRPRLDKLPPAVKRYLAKDKLYLPNFSSHPDFRIAGETLRNVDNQNLRLLLENPAVNGLLLREVLKNEALFCNHQLVRLALNHPKCDAAFATKYLQGTSRWTRARLARNVNANPRIRRMVAPVSRPAPAPRKVRAGGRITAPRGRVDLQRVGGAL